jgi:hypothetical protein
MNRIGLRMIFGAPGKYATLVFGLAFAVMLSTQQVAILLGVLNRATGPLQNIETPRWRPPPGPLTDRCHDPSGARAVTRPSADLSSQGRGGKRERPVVCRSEGAQE